MRTRLLVRQYLRRLGLLKYAQRIKTIRDRRVLQKRGWEALDACFNATRKGGALAWVEFGTLLGIARARAFIPGDLDLDVAIREEDFSQDIEGLLYENDFRKQWEFHWGGRAREVRFVWHGVGLDIFLAERAANVQFLYYFREFLDPARVYEREAYRHQLTPIDDVNWLQVSGHTIAVPARMDLALKERYGTTWQLPDPTWNTLRSPRLEKLDTPGRIETL